MTDRTPGQPTKDPAERIVKKQTRALTAGFLGACAALVFFGWLTGEVLRGESLQFDTAIRDTIHSWASTPLTYAMRGVTQLGSWYSLVALGLVFVWRLIVLGRRRAVAIFIAAAVGAQALDQILKVVLRRERPEVFFGLAQPGSYSFPSGHSVMSACFYGVMAAILTVRMNSRPRKILIWAAAALLALAVGFSRVYLGVHYPTDVLAGYAAAAIWVGAVRAGYEIWLRRRRKRTSKVSEP